MCIPQVWAADLADMSAYAKENDGYKYLLVVIDIFSKYGWLLPLKNKTGLSVAEAFKKIFKISRRKPRKLWTDKGTEFYNTRVKELVDVYSTENEEKSAIAERWIRTMKERMHKYFTANNTYRYLEALDGLVKRYNNRKHSSIGMTPTEASDPSNENTVRAKLYPLSFHSYLTVKFEVGDRVRIPRKKKTFEKGYTSRWTEEVFMISEVLYTNPPTCRITDSDGEEIKGTFYEPELQKTTQNVYRIEKVIRKRGKKALVKWMGYPESQNSWVNVSDLQKL